MYFRLFKLILIFICVNIIINVLYRLLLHSKTSLSMNKNDNIPLTKNNIDQISYSLEPFYIRLPNFSDDEAKNWFYNSSYYRINSKKCPQGLCEEKGFLFNDTKEHLSVNVFLVKNGLYINDDCGYN
ncbi:unnamed protein product, partial [Adineta steineri]